MMWNGEMSSLVDELKRGGWSCVIGNTGRMTTYSKRGVADLYRILVSEPELLLNSYIADKVVGKGAAALMVLGKVSRLHTHIISIPALVLLRNAGIHVDYDNLSPYLVEALIATEDERFYEHSGIDFIALTRAVVKRGMLGQKSAGGGSLSSSYEGYYLRRDRSVNGCGNLHGRFYGRRRRQLGLPDGSDQRGYGSHGNAWTFLADGFPGKILHCS